ncbi:MAG TPA: hypothetical protein VF969_07275, partial [Burkholderiales bacterium]
GTYSTQIDLSKTAETKKTLETARDALIGFAAANGRLPCPATVNPPHATTSNGVEAPLGGGACTVSGGGMPGLGFFPAATLALTPTDSQGYLIDSWGNRIRYAVTNSGTPPAEFTTQGQIRTKLIDGDPNTPSPDLRICTTSTGASSTTCSGTSTTLTTSAVAVIFSTGKNGATGGTGADESKNLDNDRVFISHEPAPSGAANGEFDDILIWLSPSILYNRILSGGL